MRTLSYIPALAALFSVLVLSACGGGQRVTRMERGEYRDRSGD